MSRKAKLRLGTVGFVAALVTAFSGGIQTTSAAVAIDKLVAEKEDTKPVVKAVTLGLKVASVGRSVDHITSNTIISSSSVNHITSNAIISSSSVNHITSNAIISSSSVNHVTSNTIISSSSVYHIISNTIISSRLHRFSSSIFPTSATLPLPRRG